MQAPQATRYGKNKAEVVVDRKNQVKQFKEKVQNPLFGSKESMKTPLKKALPFGIPSYLDDKNFRLDDLTVLTEMKSSSLRNSVDSGMSDLSKLQALAHLRLSKEQKAHLFPLHGSSEKNVFNP
jgi:hypothetical protein